CNRAHTITATTASSSTGTHAPRASAGQHFRQLTAPSHHAHHATNGSAAAKYGPRKISVSASLSRVSASQSSHVIGVPPQRPAAQGASSPSHDRHARRRRQPIRGGAGRSAVKNPGKTCPPRGRVPHTLVDRERRPASKFDALPRGWGAADATQEEVGKGRLTGRIRRGTEGLGASGCGW